MVAQPSRLLLGIPFSATLLLILFSHEMGHYLFCRYYGVRATLPFFIPAPTLIGTLGAVIRIKAPIRSRAALFDIGIAGPIAGFVVAVVTLAVAMTLSKPLDPGMGPSELQLGFPAIFHIMHSVLRSAAPHHAIAALPLRQVYLHPTAVAAWVGMFATALNLLPSSQLDGGHIVYALAPRVHRAVSWITVIRPGLPGAPICGMVRVGRIAHGDERDDLPRGASARISHASGKPLAAGGAGSDHAGTHVYDLALPDELAIGQVRLRSRLWLLP